MAELEILTIPDARLKQLSEPVTEFDQALTDFLDDLEQTRQLGPAAVGIAAPQVGNFQRIAIVECSTTRKPVPNHGRLFKSLMSIYVPDWERWANGTGRDL